MSDVVLFDIIDAQITACGFLGGMVHAFRAEKITPWEAVGYVVIGGIAANFITPLAANFIMPQALKMVTTFPAGAVYFIGFCIGMSGKHLCGTLEIIFNRLLGKTKNE
jgi:hypothetical protein